MLTFFRRFILREAAGWRGATVGIGVDVGGLTGWMQAEKTMKTGTSTRIKLHFIHGSKSLWLVRENELTWSLYQEARCVNKTSGCVINKTIFFLCLIQIKKSAIKIIYQRNWTTAGHYRKKLTPSFVVAPSKVCFMVIIWPIKVLLTLF
jgi:hypothetical protein